MSLLFSLPIARDCSDSELVARLPELVKAEHHAVADMIEHLVEIERRRLYLSQSVSSLYRYCIERLGYDEDAALKRHRVAKLALRLPQVLDELRAGTLHLTGLFLLAKHLTEDNAAELLGEARGRSRRKIEELIARWFPRPDVPASIVPLGESVAELGSERTKVGQLMLVGSSSPAAVMRPLTCSGAGNCVPGRLEPLSPSRVRVEFTARAELYKKLEKARALLSHALPSGELGELFERALDALLERETRKRFGAKALGESRKRSAAKARCEAAMAPIAPDAAETGKAPEAGEAREASEAIEGCGTKALLRAPKRARASRHVPVHVVRAVWGRDRSQCTHIDAAGRRCPERRFLTIEHRTPFALGGQHSLDNLCLLCRGHNLESARQVFGESLIQARVLARTKRETPAPRADARAASPERPPRAKERAASHEPAPFEPAAQLRAALCQLGFGRSESSAAVGRVLGGGGGFDVEQLLRKCLQLLVPAASCSLARRTVSRRQSRFLDAGVPRQRAASISGAVACADERASSSGVGASRLTSPQRVWSGLVEANAQLQAACVSSALIYPARTA
jgi:5-methylcytosine-specific restriction endonuclease McrA